jgi:hypothetical protein
MKLDNFDHLKPGDEYDPGAYLMALHEDMKTIKACLRYILGSYERAEGHPGALVVNSLLEKLEEK